jgi:CBS domain-containing protein
MRVFEIMSDRVSTVAPDTPVAEARERLEAAGTRHLVVTSDRRLVGIVARRDLAAAAPGAPVGDVMISPVVTIEKTATVRKAANLFEGRAIGCLPVTDRGRLAGVVTINDVLRLVGKGIDRPQPPGRRTANHRVPHRKAHSATGRW